MRITSKGQVTIPIAIREKAGLMPNTEVEFRVDGNTVTIVRATKPRRKGRGAELIAHMRRHAGKVTMSTDEIMALTRGE
jgi:AbrB family looped-hinge helix DNA binding protein